jgi:hypothetical protein
MNLQRLPGPVSPVIKQHRREANHLTPSSAEVKNGWSYTPIPSAGLYVGHSGNFTVYLGGHPRNGGGGGECRFAARPPNQNFTNTDFVDTMILNVLRDLPFS